MTLNNKKINLRALEPEDLDFLYQIENDESFWEVSHTQKPFSKYLLKQYLETAHLDIYETKQLRFIIEETATKNQLGMIDIFDFDPQHKRAGIGILIHPDFQKKGFASEALSLLIKYSFSYLQLHQLYANITSDNLQSISLFKKQNFSRVGLKKDWILSEGKFKDEILFQLIKV
ncbi:MULTISPECIES: GNAT family N-acetyltransferase [unclassified Polaribacter]|uniref:GNAT family N-acetyltransferase n=1 Tax=unclassified Polaribacter TaxID=196858 RepID=UPI0011BE5562|nr:MULTISPECIES: GNAT family N-acetyltransferase [unclassified Polaribacter]TXD50529.1 GNAT family N-acetyltransferase [Polaribacter sp. IC063]TXD59052.1 GNAT family N-acetyltransferase [Polaribacter sp. IC066]